MQNSFDHPLPFLTLILTVPIYIKPWLSKLWSTFKNISKHNLSMLLHNLPFYKKTLPLCLDKKEHNRKNHLNISFYPCILHIVLKNKQIGNYLAQKGK